MSINAHLLYDYGKEFITHLQNKISNKIELTVGEDISLVSDYHILIAGVPKLEHLIKSTRLHTLIIPWAGLPQKTAELMKDFPQISIHNLHHNDQTTAEMAFTLMTAAMKRIIPIDKDFRHSNWHKRYNDEPILLLKDKKVIVLGYGAIGKKLTQMCQSFGMDVSVISRTKKEIQDAYTIDKLDDLLPECDVLLVTLPLTASTKNLIKKEQLALLPADATIVNIARAAIIDEKALYAELKSGRLRAGLDVWYSYPATPEERTYTEPSKYPFHNLENVVMTPHLAGHSDQTEKMRIEHLAILLNQAANDERLNNKVDLELGY